MTDDPPTVHDRSELLNGKNPVADARLMAAITRAKTSPTRIPPGTRASTSPKPAPTKGRTKPKGFSRTGQKMTRGITAR